MNSGISLFASESTLQLIKWICQFNRRHPDEPVKVFGFDINHYAPKQNIKIVRGVSSGFRF